MKEVPAENGELEANIKTIVFSENPADTLDKLDDNFIKDVSFTLIHCNIDAEISPEERERAVSKYKKFIDDMGEVYFN